MFTKRCRYKSATFAEDTMIFEPLWHRVRDGDRPGIRAKIRAEPS